MGRLRRPPLSISISSNLCHHLLSLGAIFLLTSVSFQIITIYTRITKITINYIYQNHYIHQNHQNCQNHVPVCNSCCMPINLVQSTFTFESEFGTAVRCLKVNRNINLAHLHKCIITGPFQSSYFDKPI